MDDLPIKLEVVAGGGGGGGKNGSSASMMSESESNSRGLMTKAGVFNFDRCSRYLDAESGTRYIFQMNIFTLKSNPNTKKY